MIKYLNTVNTKYQIGKVYNQIELLTKIGTKLNKRNKNEEKKISKPSFFLIAMLKLIIRHCYQYFT